jgi:steroid 5-alpha reductase family enzyme
MIKLFIDFNSSAIFNQLFGASETLSTLAANWILTFIITVTLCFILGELTRNLSQVDKVWSIMPIVYSAYTLVAFPTSARVWIMSGLVTFWGLRLSYNF